MQLIINNVCIFQTAFTFNRFFKPILLALMGPIFRLEYISDILISLKLFCDILNCLVPFVKPIDNLTDYISIRKFLCGGVGGAKKVCSTSLPTCRINAALLLIYSYQSDLLNDHVARLHV